MKKDETYYFGESRGKLMKAMSRQELYARLADAYQLAGAMLIGARILDEHYDDSPPRNVNGWTDEEVALAVETLLNFLSCPAELTKEKFDRANAVYRKRDPNEAIVSDDMIERWETSIIKHRVKNGMEPKPDYVRAKIQEALTTDWGEYDHHQQESDA